METSNHFRKATLPDLPRFAEPASRDETPNIAKRSWAATIYSLAVVSGILSNIAVWQLDRPCIFYFAPGVLFGLLVLLPWCGFCQVSWGQTVATVCLAPLGYAAAVCIHHSAFSIFAGLVGGSITFAPLLLKSHPRVRGSVYAGLAVGWVLGAPMQVYALVGGVLVWQVAVGYCLSQALMVDDPQ